MSDVSSILNTVTVTTAGSFVFRAGNAAEASLVYNIGGPITGSITLTVAEVDPSDELSVIGISKTTAPITSAGTGVVTVSLYNSTTVRVSWTVSVGASIGGVTLSIFRKAYPGLAAVTFGASGGSATLTRTISLSYDQSIATPVNNGYFRALSYTVPALYTATILKFTSYQNESAFSRVLVTKTLGSHNNNTNVFTGVASYSNIQFSGISYLYVTTAIAAGAGSVAYTITYTNQDGTAGRTATASVPRGSIVGTIWTIILQSSDYGIRSVQSVSGTPTVIGVVDVVGSIPLGIHADRDSTAQVETVFSPGTLTVGSDEQIVIEYAGSATSKQRIFDILLQLIQ